MCSRASCCEVTEGPRPASVTYSWWDSSPPFPHLGLLICAPCVHGWGVVCESPTWWPVRSQVRYDTKTSTSLQKPNPTQSQRSLWSAPRFISELRCRHPRAKILLLACFPCTPAFSLFLLWLFSLPLFLVVFLIPPLTSPNTHKHAHTHSGRLLSPLNRCWKKSWFAGPVGQPPSFPLNLAW